MKTASDPNFALQVMSLMNMRTPQDCALAAMGVFRYYYYCFCHEYHYPPKDLIDLIDGVLYNEVVQYAEKYFIKQQQLKQNGKS